MAKTIFFSSIMSPLRSKTKKSFQKQQLQNSVMDLPDRFPNSLYKPSILWPAQPFLYTEF